MKTQIGSPASKSLLGTACSLTLCLVSAGALAQPAPGQGRGGFGIDARATSDTYHFADTNVDLPYCYYVSSKVDPDEPAPLIISLHGMGATPDIMCNSTAVDLAEEGGYILASPMGYNTTGWYGSPLIEMGGAGRGGRGANAAPQMSFDTINQPGANGSPDDHLTPDEIRAFFGNIGGRGAAPAANAPAPAADAPAGGDFVADVITRWDANADGMVTRQEFDNRPPAGGRGAAGGGRGGFGGGGEQPENLEELSEKDVMNVLAMMREEYNVDEDRIYLTGHSMGGAGTFFLGAKHADVWAAIAPVAPAAFMMTDDRAEILGDLADADVPVMVVHGDVDEAVPVSLAQTWVATMDEIGMEHEYVELPGVTHGPVITISQEYVFEFFDKHSK